MITKRYVTIFLVGSCLLLDHSSQIPLQTSLHNRTSRGAITLTGGGRKNLSLRPALGEVPSVEGKRRWRRQGRLGAHRIKRGWVWNQFFVLEEYMGSEPQYVGKLHTEMDQGDNAVKYTLSGEGVGSVFTIDQMTGDIHAQVVLDREKKSFYTLKAQAVDIHTGIPLEPESEFIIKVQDINDNEPQFPDGPYSASVPEMSPTGTYVTQVTATDADDPTYGNSARIVYSILHGQPYFSVDPKTGIIRTALANMDREVKQEYQVLLQAKDMGGQLGGLASTTIINITLTDVNDNPPRFTKSIFHLHVPESASLGAAVGRIQAQDLDVGSNARVDYAIVPGDEGNMFDIISNGQSQEGIVVLKKTLDYETQASYTFKVEAFNAELDPRFLHLGPFKDSVTVKINVLDVDEPPVFTTPYYSLDVYEDTPPGTIIGSVTAYDLDASSSAVRYSLEWQTGSDSFFDIETVEGIISTNEYLDRETAVLHNITVVATKLNNPSLSAEVLVKVNVLDVNEFPPQLTAPSDTFVCENSRAGQVIQTVGAVDEDHPPVGQRFFFKSSKELRNRNFTVRDYGNNTAGIVTRHSAFQRRLQDVYILPVVVEDSGYPAQSSTATLTIRVCSCETVGSPLTCSPVAMFLPADLSAQALLAILLSIALLIGMSVLYMGQRPQKVKDTLMRSKEDIRDNVIHYDDEGGGEADTDAFHMGTLCKTDHSSISNKKKNGYGDGILMHLSTHCDNVRSPDIHLQTASFIATGNKPPLFCRGRATQGDAELIREVIEHRLKESQQGYAALPGDSLATYAYEGDGSEAHSLSSIEDSFVLDSLGDFSSLGDWGQPFKTLASILDKQPPSLFNES
ncbi:cadherin-12-like isoform X1 [Pelmatolapia mariae]|uniref:cadherin-12-like isoform X1 n=2 Tax=Pelmatolapia mariae TaxID=158779 RepID=UPI002FE56C0C